LNLRIDFETFLVPCPTNNLRVLGEVSRSRARRYDVGVKGRYVEEAQPRRGPGGPVRIAGYFWDTTLACRLKITGL